MLLQWLGVLISQECFRALAAAVEALVEVSLVWESHYRLSMIRSDCRVCTIASCWTLHALI